MQNPDIRYFIQYPFKQVSEAYPSAVIRLYCRIRSHILRQKLLAEVGQSVPIAGNIVEFGCGFGLFSLCFAITRPKATVFACDLNAGRIETAEDVATKLDVRNCHFSAMDAVSFVERLPSFRCAYMFDLLHHMPRSAVHPFLTDVWNRLESGGVLIVKDVDSKPYLKMAFTYVLDLLMTKGERPEYFSSQELAELLASLGGEVHVHGLDDYLPFPHRLFTVVKN